jgi:peroxiredoxin
VAQNQNSQMTQAPIPSGFQLDTSAIVRALENATTETGAKLIHLVEHSPVLLVFLRHAGCTFCRETLSDIDDMRAAIEADGTRIVLVHLGDRSEIRDLVRKYYVENLERICDPSLELYSAFGLTRGSFWQLFGPKVWWRGLIAGWIRGHGVGHSSADSGQMPGVFLIDDGIVTNRFRHRSAADRPSYVEICEIGRRDTR